MLAKTILLFLVGGLNFLVGAIVLARDSKKLQNRLFFLFSLSLCGWVVGIGGFLLAHDPNVAFTWAKLYYAFPLVVAAVMPLFSLTFPYNARLPKRIWVPILLGYLVVTVPLLTQHTFITSRLVYHDWGKEILLNKAHYLLYSVYLLSCFAVGLIHTFLKAQRVRGLARVQTNFYFYGFLLTSFFGVYFNLILPWFGNYRLIWLGPLFTNAFVIAIAYSIIKHRMFDVRVVIARSLTYLFSLAALATIYGFVVFGVAQSMFDLHFSVGVQIFISATTGIASLSFRYLRQLFDKLTNRIFYRDAYDSQTFFDEVNKALVSTIDLDELLSRTTEVIAKYLKSQYCLIGLKKTDGTEGQRIVGTDTRDFSAKEIAQVRGITPHIHQAVIVTDDMPPEQARLRQLLQKNDIAILARLTTDFTRTHEGLGYIVLGAKKSGNPYTNQDVKVIETVAKELIIAIQNALRFEEIENFNIILQERIKEATHRLSESNKKLKAMDETKDDFIGMASHQLRTPLTSVKGYLSLVLDGDAGKITAQQRQLLTQAFISSQRMVFLIADLLNVSRLKTGKFIIETTPVNLADMIADEVAQLKETAASRDLTLEFHRPQHFPTIDLDETKTRQVVMNFLDNAVYYTPSGGHITATLTETPKSIELRVTDDGIGVPKAEQHHLFNKFYRAKNAQKARPDGTGLGLFMAKKVVIAQGGAIIFDSKEGQGSTFGFTFPKKRTLPAPENLAQ